MSMPIGKELLLDMGACPCRFPCFEGSTSNGLMPDEERAVPPLEPLAKGELDAPPTWKENQARAQR